MQNDLKVALVGIGESGCGYVSKIKTDAYPVKKIYIDTDARDLGKLGDVEKLMLSGPAGLGTGWDPQKGAVAARDNSERIVELFADTKMVILVSAFGHGTGSGATPVIARILREQQKFVAAFVTMPFSYDGDVPVAAAREAYSLLSRECHFLLRIDCDRLSFFESQGSIVEMYEKPREWIDCSVQKIFSLLFSSDENLRMDFVEFHSFFPVAGAPTLFSIGEGDGADAIRSALDSLSACPLIEPQDKSDTAVVIVSIAAFPTGEQANLIASGVAKKMGATKRVRLCYDIVPGMGDKIKLCVIGAIDIKAAENRRKKYLTPTDVTNAMQDSGSFALDYTGEGGLPIDDRGIFEGVPRLLYEGEDLEVPTYIRRRVNLEKSLKEAQKK